MKKAIPIFMLIISVTCLAQETSQIKTAKKTYNIMPTLSFDFNKTKEGKVINVDKYKKSYGYTIGLKKEHHLKERFNLATKVSFTHGRSGENKLNASKFGLNGTITSRLSSNIFKVGEALQYSIETKHGVFRPTLAIDVGYGRMKDTFDIVANNSQRASLEGTGKAFI